MISLQEAKSIISNNTFELQSERVHLTLAGNRVLGQDVVASFPYINNGQYQYGRDTK